MKPFPPERVRLVGGGGPPSGLDGAGSPLLFGSREHELAVGFVAARVRLLNLVRGSWTADVRPLADLLSALTASPAGPESPAIPSRVRVRLQEPQSGAGMVVFPLSWEAERGGEPALPVLDAQLTLRSGSAGQTFLRVNGSVRPQWAAPASGFVQVPSVASVESWLSAVADALAQPPALCGQPAQIGNSLAS
jgi:hypothetical protein